MPNKQRPSAGFTCPDCAKIPDRPPRELRVQHTRARTGRIVTRYRKCPECGYTLTTDERVVKVRPARKQQRKAT